MDNTSAVIEDECEESIDKPKKDKGLSLDARHFSREKTFENKDLMK